FVNFEYQGFEETILRLNAIFLDQVELHIASRKILLGNNRRIDVPRKLSGSMSENFWRKAIPPYAPIFPDADFRHDRWQNGIG
ncbi:hypothetical protein, partial [Leptospira bourretii]|uniref:hypothetical protein n=1 Tax=Leptospira bourretii TaxID=2484962 RepID=UPI001ABFCF0B